MSNATNSKIVSTTTVASGITSALVAAGVLYKKAGGLDDHGLPIELPKGELAKQAGIAISVGAAGFVLAAGAVKATRFVKSKLAARRAAKETANASAAPQAAEAAPAAQAE